MVFKALVYIVKERAPLIWAFLDIFIISKMQKEIHQRRLNAFPFIDLLANQWPL